MTTVTQPSALESPNTWQVGILMQNGTIAISGRETFPTREAAEREALRQHKAKPFMGFVVIAA